MNCPLKKQVVIKEDGDLIWLHSEAFICDEASCAWWFGSQECCSIPAIANSLECANRRKEAHA